MHLDRRVSALMLHLQAWARAHRHRASLESGEGVISAAIVVLIMAIIGAAMWVAFDNLWDSADSTISSEFESIGS